MVKLKNSKVAKVYARTFFLSLKNEESQLLRSYQDMQVILEMLKTSLSALFIKEVFANPLISKQGKKERSISLFNKMNMSPQVINFITFLIDKKRAYLLFDIAELFCQLYYAYKNIVVATVTVPYEMTKEQLERLRTVSEKGLKKSIVMRMVVNKRIIAGLIIELNGKVLDMSLLAQLHSIKRQLLMS